MDYCVWLERTPQHYGGHRVWWICPRCGQRRAVLFGVSGSDGRFGCIGSHPNRPQHRCMDLAYTVEALLPRWRLERRADRIGARLEESEDGRRWIKPKGMHWRTFNALVDRANDAAGEADACFALGALRMLERHGFTPK
jgi:hypothetical protein